MELIVTRSENNGAGAAATKSNTFLYLLNNTVNLFENYVDLKHTFTNKFLNEYTSIQRNLKQLKANYMNLNNGNEVSLICECSFSIE